MANYTIDPNMGFRNPTPTQEVGPDYAQDISDGLTTIGGHNHLGDGLTGPQLSQDSLNISGDLSLNQHNATNVRTVAFTDQTSVPVGVGDVRVAFFKDGNLYIVNGSGAAVQITAGSAVNVTSANTIYASQSVSANWTIVSTDSYVRLNVDTTAARLITLPTAASVSPGRYYIVCDATGGAQSNPITISKASTDTIDGSTSHLVSSAYGSVMLISDGLSKWKALDIFNTQAGQITTGSAPARSGAIALSNTQAIKFRNAANSADVAALSVDASDLIQVGTGLSLSGSNLGLAAINQLWSSASSPSISQSTQTSNIATNNLTLSPQPSFASATGTNRTGGNLVVNLAAPTNSGTIPSAVQVKTGATIYNQIGQYAVGSNYGCFWGGTTAPSQTNFAFLGDGLSAAYFNAPSSGSLSLSFGGAGATGLDMTTSQIASAIPTWVWYSGVSSPTITQATLASGTGNTLSITSQSVTTGTASDLILGGGSGSVASGGVTINSGATKLAQFTLGNLGLGYGTRGYLVVTNNGGIASAGQILSVAYGGDAYYISNTGHVRFGDSTNQTVVSVASSDGLILDNNAFTFTTAKTAPLIKQADNTTNSATGSVLKISAQSVTGTSATGGALSLNAGNSTTSGNGGAVSISAGTATSGSMGSMTLTGLTTLLISPTIQMYDASVGLGLQFNLASSGTTSIMAGLGVTALTIGQTIKTSGTAAKLTIAAQGSSSGNGGILQLQSGTSSGGTEGTVILGVGGLTTNGLTMTPSAVGLGGAGVMTLTSTSLVLADLSATALTITPVSSGATTITVASTVASVAFGQTALGSGTGAAWSLTAQGGGSGTGGGITLSGGAGTTQGGDCTIAGANSTTQGGGVNILTGSGTTKGTFTLKTGGSAGTIRMSANSTGLGFYTATPVAQATKIANYTDSTAGTPGTTLAAIVGTTYTSDVGTIRNWIASLNKQINDLKNQLSAAAGGIGITT